MKSKLLNNSMSIPETLILSEVSRSVWKLSLKDNAGAIGAEFLGYLDSDLWIQHEMHGMGRHYIMPRLDDVEGTPYRSYWRILMPLIAKAIILSKKNTVYYAPLTRFIRRLYNDEIPNVDIIIIDGFNDVDDLQEEFDHDHKFMVEDYLYDCMNRKRRVYTSGGKPFTQSSWWHNNLIANMSSNIHEFDVTRVENDARR